MTKKRNDKESMICFKSKPSQKKKTSEIDEVSLRPPSSTNLNTIGYVIWGVLENKTNATSHPNIGFLKTVIEYEWNKMIEELILMACKSFRRSVDTIIEKKNGGQVE